MTSPAHLPAPSTRHLTPSQREQLAENLDEFATYVYEIVPDPVFPEDSGKTIFRFFCNYKENDYLCNLFDRIVSTGISRKEFLRRATAAVKRRKWQTCP